MNEKSADQGQRSLDCQESRFQKTENFVCPEGMPTALTVTGSRNENILIGSPQISAENSSLSPKAAEKVQIN